MFCFYHVWKQYVILLIVILHAAIYCISNTQYSVHFITIDGPGSVSHSFYLCANASLTCYMMNVFNVAKMCICMFISWHQKSAYGWISSPWETVMELYMHWFYHGRWLQYKGESHKYLSPGILHIIKIILHFLHLLDSHIQINCGAVLEKALIANHHICK